jgi:chromosome segregation ATPase
MAVSAPLMDITARINGLKAQIEKGKVEKARAEANLAMYEKQREEIIAQLAELGVTPENVDAEIARLDREIEEALARAEQLLRG